MAVRNAEAVWEGNLQEGKGSMKLGSGAFEGAFTFASRFEEGPGTNPEELIGAAHAGCYSMFLSAVLSNDGHVPNRVHTTATVHLGRDDSGPKITKIELNCEAEVPGLDEATFQEHAANSKTNCPISRALASTDIQLKATLL
jgi:osmotically inducible protein OsmC